MDIPLEELEEILDREKNLEQMIALSGLDVNASIFRSTPLKRFFTKTMAEINPVLSVSSITLDYYDRIFSRFIMPRVCFTFWDIQNDCETYEYWPEALKMEAFVERAWKENYEDDLKAKFIYDL